MIEASTIENRRILVIDDNSAIHEDFRKILAEGDNGSSEINAMEAALFGDAETRATGARFQLDSAYQGEEGLELVRQASAAGAPYAMAFVDVRMPPGWDGIETISRIWQVDPNLEVVICTAFSDYSWDQMIDKFGETDRLLLLKKPFDNIEVRQFAVALTAKWELSRRAEEGLARMEHAMSERMFELKNQKAQLEDTHAQLLQAQKLESIGQLAAGIAHEINTPIQYVGDNIRFLGENVTNLFALVDSYASFIDPEQSPSAWAERVAKINALLEELDYAFLKDEIPGAIAQSLEGVERVAKIVQSMKEFSHPGGDDKQMVDLNRAIETTITVARNEWKYVANLETDFDPALPMVPCLIGDLNQVMLNMIVNAAHAIVEVNGPDSETKGRIAISTRRDGEWVVIQIRDSGVGIPEDIQSRIFDPFFTTKDVGKGTGQGLAIARRCIQKHAGTLMVDSTPGKGATFTIRLPLEETTAEDSKGQCRDEEAHPVC